MNSRILCRWRPWGDTRCYAALALVCLCLYSGIVGPRQIDTIPEAISAPQPSPVIELSLGADVQVVAVQEHEFRVQQLGTPVPVRIPAHLETAWQVWRKELQVGDYVSLRATYHAESGGYLLLHELHVHKGRRLKMWVSLLALVVPAGLLTKEWLKHSAYHA